MESKSLLAKIGAGTISVYQTLTHPIYDLTGMKLCRFEPSCSEYTKQAIEKYGLFRGTGLGIERISRCRPGCPSGHDPLK